MKILKKATVAIFVLLLFVFLYYGARELFLSDGFDEVGSGIYDFETETFVYDNSIGIYRYPEGLEVGDKFSFYRHYKLPVISYLPIEYFVTEPIFHRKVKYNLCFENISYPYPLLEGPSCEWLNCTGYRYSAGNFSSDELDSELVNSRDVFIKNFPEDKIPAKAKLTKDKSCANYEEINSLFEYKVNYTDVEQKDLLIGN